MEILISCSHCGKRLHVHSEVSVKRAKCSACGNLLEIPVQQFNPPTEASDRDSAATAKMDESADDVMSWLQEGEQSKRSDFSWTSDPKAEPALIGSVREHSGTNRDGALQTESKNRPERHAGSEAVERGVGVRNKIIALVVTTIVVGVFIVGLAMLLIAAKKHSEQASDAEAIRANFEEKRKTLDDYSHKREQLKQNLERQKAEYDSKNRELVTSFDTKERILDEKEKGLQALEKSLAARELSVVERERAVATRASDFRFSEIAAAREAARREEVERRNSEQAARILAEMAADRLSAEARERLERYLLQLDIGDRPRSVQAMLMLGSVQWAWRNNKYDDPDVLKSVKLTLSEPSVVRIVEEVVAIGGDIRFSRKNLKTGKDEYITMKETYSLALRILRTEVGKFDNRDYPVPACQAVSIFA